MMINYANEPWLTKFLSPSKLDRFAKYRDDDEYTAEMYIKDMIVFEPSIYARAGTAAHSYVEGMLEGKIGGDFVQHCGFKINCVDELDITIQVPTVREQWVRYPWRGLTIVGKLDAYDSTEIVDYKFTIGGTTIDKLIDSWQWKTYLTMKDCTVFKYHLFKIFLDEIRRAITIEGYDELRLLAYDGMADAVHSILDECAETVLQLKPLVIKIAQENNITLKM